MIYTKTGDAGTTSLVGGTRVLKCDDRVEAYGTVDELNAHVGLLAEMIKATDPAQYTCLKQVQDYLFIIQTLLATEETAHIQLPQLPDDAVTDLEHRIDQLQAQLPQLRSFVIPGGNAAAAQCHVARTVCRRAERRIVQLRQQHPVAHPIECYINRLSDFLFVLSRHTVLSQGDTETLYHN